MKIALLGGAFNPPHLGHVIIARQVLDFTDVDEVWYLPNWGQYYFGRKPHKEVAPAEHRLAMLNYLVFDKAITSTIEIDHQLDGQTIHLLPHLPPEHELSFIIGSDQLPTFRLWQGWQELLKTMRFLIFPRYGYPVVEPIEENMSIVKHELLIETSISSTIVRERIKKGLSISQFVPLGVANYIQEHNLYLEGARGRPEEKRVTY